MSINKHLSLSLVAIVHLLMWGYLINHSASVVMYFNVEGVDIPESYIADGIFFSMIFNAVIFYLNYSYLIEKYLLHHSIRYLVLAVTLLIFVTLCETLTDVIQIDAMQFLASHDIGSTLFFYNLQINFAYLISAILLKIAMDWLQQIKLQKE